MSNHFANVAVACCILYLHLCNEHY